MDPSSGDGGVLPAGPRLRLGVACLTWAVAPNGGAVLLHDVYGWFECRGHGVYQLTGLGGAALLRWIEAPLNIIAVADAIVEGDPGNGRMRLSEAA